MLCYKICLSCLLLKLCLPPPNSNCHLVCKPVFVIQVDDDPLGPLPLPGGLGRGSSQRSLVSNKHLVSSNRSSTVVSHGHFLTWPLLRVSPLRISPLFLDLLVENVFMPNWHRIGSARGSSHRHDRLRIHRQHHSCGRGCWNSWWLLLHLWQLLVAAIGSSVDDVSVQAAPLLRRAEAASVVRVGAAAPRAVTAGVGRLRAAPAARRHSCGGGSCRSSTVRLFVVVERHPMYNHWAGILKRCIFCTYEFKKNRQLTKSKITKKITRLE